MGNKRGMLALWQSAQAPFERGGRLGDIPLAAVNQQPLYAYRQY